MLIRYKNNGVEKHVENAVGRGFIDAGLATEVPSTPKHPERIPNLQFSAREGAYVGLDYQFSPSVHWGCSTCGTMGAVSNPSAGFVVRHCRIAEEIPRHIREQYDALLKAYNARSRRKNVSPTALVTSTALSDRVADPRILGHFGIKTKEQLVLQTASDIELAKRIASKK